MSPASSRIESDVAAPQSLEWRSWPIWDEPFTGALGLGAAACLSVAVHAAGRRWPWTVAALAALSVSGWRLWLPQRYEISATGVTQTRLGRVRRLGWRAVRSATPAARGVWLCADPAFAPIDSLHDLFLPYGKQRDAVLAGIERWFGPLTRSQ